MTGFAICTVMFLLSCKTTAKPKHLLVETKDGGGGGGDYGSGEKPSWCSPYSVVVRPDGEGAGSRDSICL